jgi:hypothetical protein
VPPLLASSASASLGTVQVIENRGFAADWTATVSSTGFTTATGRGWPGRGGGVRLTARTRSMTWLKQELASQSAPSADRGRS